MEPPGDGCAWTSQNPRAKQHQGKKHPSPKNLRDHHPTTKPWEFWESLIFRGTINQKPIDHLTCSLWSRGLHRTGWSLRLRTQMPQVLYVLNMCVSPRLKTNITDGCKAKQYIYILVPLLLLLLLLLWLYWKLLYLPNPSKQLHGTCTCWISVHDFAFEGQSLQTPVEFSIYSQQFLVPITITFDETLGTQSSGRSFFAIQALTEFRDYIYIHIYKYLIYGHLSAIHSQPIFLHR